MGFGQRWPVREPRPKGKKLSKCEINDMQTAMERAIMLNMVKHSKPLAGFES